MQPQLKSKVRCVDREIGEVSKVIMDPLSFAVSHVVVSMNGSGERQIPMSDVQTVTEELVQLRSSSSEVMGLPHFIRENFVTLHEVEVPGLERHVHVVPDVALVPFPELERSVERRTFFAKLSYVTGLFIGLPFAFPVLKFLMKPMYMAMDNQWLKVGNVSQVKAEDSGTQFQYKRMVKEVYMPEAEVEKSVWLVKASPEVLEKVYDGKDKDFLDASGKVIWTNKKDVPYLAFSGKCPHLGCAFKWRKHKVLGQVFLCPCHLSIYDATGKVLDGPAPRALDMLPIQVSAAGDVQIIDMEFKAGTKSQTRII